jgi:uncharacterized protein (DUF433 family)
MGSVEVLAGTRVPVATIRRLHRAGWSAARIIDNYPGLTAKDIAVAVRKRASG